MVRAAHPPEHLPGCGGRGGAAGRRLREGPAPPRPAPLPGSTSLCAQEAPPQPCLSPGPLPEPAPPYVSSRVQARQLGGVGGFRRGPRTWGDRCAARCQMQAGDRSRRWAVAVSLVSLGSRSGFLSPFLSLFSFVSKRFPPASLHFWVKNLTDVWLYGGVFVGACACPRTQCQL